jgi:hypothetical protein
VVGRWSASRRWNRTVLPSGILAVHGHRAVGAIHADHGANQEIPRTGVGDALVDQAAHEQAVVLDAGDVERLEAALIWSTMHSMAGTPATP